MISLIIVNYHLADSALRALDSAFQACKNHPMEAFLVDNSNDSNEALRLRWGVQKSPWQQHCQLLINTENTGFGRACNRAFALAKGEWIALLNPDAWYLPSALDTMLEYLQKHPKVAAVGPRVYWDSEQQVLLPANIQPGIKDEWLNQPASVMHAAITWTNSLMARKRQLHYWQTDKPLFLPQLSGGHVVIRRKSLPDNKLFDPLFFLYYEDSDLFLRLRKAGWKLAFLPAAEVIHQFDSCGREQLQWKREKMQEARQHYFNKHHSSQKIKTSTAVAAKTWMPKIISSETLQQPFSFATGYAKNVQWLAEWSYSPYCVPAAGFLGCGERCNFPASLWKILPSDNYWLRIAPLRQFWLAPEIRHYQVNL